MQRTGIQSWKSRNTAYCLMSREIGIRRLAVKLPGFKIAIVTSPPCEELIRVLRAMRWNESLSNELLLQVFYHHLAH